MECLLQRGPQPSRGAPLGSTRVQAQGTLAPSHLFLSAEAPGPLNLKCPLLLLLASVFPFLLDPQSSMLTTKKHVLSE